MYIESEARIGTLRELLDALADAGVGTFIDCEDHLSFWFDKAVNSSGDKVANADDVRIYDDDTDYVSPVVTIESGSCGGRIDIIRKK
jgi:hypothetical protein